MKFRIERVSGETPPCEGAVLNEYRADEYYFPSRTLSRRESYYEIEVDSLEQLLEIAGIEGHGIIIDFVEKRNEKKPRIIIYDDYVE